MKKIITAIIVLAVSASAFAQQKDAHQKGQKIESEKVAFISHKMNLTVQEAEKFWPVYNKILAEQKAQNKALREAKASLRQALKKKDQPIDEAEVSKCLKKYVDAQKGNQNIPAKYYSELIKVLPAEKVARYYMAEETFRTQQIKKMRGAGPVTGQQMDNSRGHGPRE